MDLQLTNYQKLRKNASPEVVNFFPDRQWLWISLTYQILVPVFGWKSELFAISLKNEKKPNGASVPVDRPWFKQIVE